MLDQILALVQATASSSTDRNSTIALTTLLINYSVLLTSSTHKALSSSSSHALSLLDPLCTVIGQATDSEAVYRALVASGTLLGLGEEVQEAASSVFSLREKAQDAEKKFTEVRIKNVAEEIRHILLHSENAVALVKVHGCRDLE